MTFQIGSLSIPYYGFFIVLGIAAGSVAGLYQTRRFGLNPDDFIILAAMVALGAVIGSKLLYLIVAWRQIDFSRLSDIDYLNSLLGGGFVFYGGVIGGILMLIPCRKLIGSRLPLYINACMPAIPIFHGFGRLGCNAAGCCYGIPYDGPFAVMYTASLAAPNHVHLFPVQAAEAVGEFIIAAVLLIYTHKAGQVKAVPSAGADVSSAALKTPSSPAADRGLGFPAHSLAIYLLLYAPLRFVLEYFRYDDAERGIFGLFSTSQWISLFLFLFAVVSLFPRKTIRKAKSAF